jgi:penicillin amidase
MLALLFVTLIGGYLGLVFLYQVKDSGTIYLPNARGVASVTRESDTHKPHIRANDLDSAVYAQGFVVAQDRLWQMERTRRTARGELAELFGHDALPIDKFFRRLGIRKLSEESYELLPEDEKEFLQAYADGINDYVAGVELMGDNPTARLLPPEFLTFGISKETWRPWSPVDSLAVFRLLSFHLSWNWMNDLMRESFR